jgi:hypothetical protein
MADQSSSARFQALFESALQAYERKTGVTLSQHPLALDLQNCHTVDGITILLQGRAQAFTDFRARDRIMRSIETIVSILAPLSDAASLADGFGLVSQADEVSHVADRLLSDIIPTYKSNTGWPRYHTRRMCRSLVHTSMCISPWHPTKPGSQRRNIKLRRTR